MRNGKVYLKIIVAVIAVSATIIAVASLTSKGGKKDNPGNDKVIENTGNNTQTEIEKDEPVDEAEDKDKTTENNETDENVDQGPEESGQEKESPKREIKPVKTRAVYLTGNSAGKKEVIDKIIELSKTTELNAVVIDVKEAGVVNYISNVPEVVKNGLYKNYYNPEELVKKLHDNNIYVIGRIVCFLDNGLGTKRPDLAIKKKNGEPWSEGKWGIWVNPYYDEVKRYNLDIAKEAAEKGFDEIQFDYVRFPSGTGKQVDFGSDVPSKADAICEFLDMASKEIKEEMGVMVSADVFGIICIDQNTRNTIGQDLERVGQNIDYICPMVYPSHYANDSNHYTGNGVGQKINGILFTAPDLEPYKVIYNTLIIAKDRISKVEGYKAKVRPYLQSFTAKYLPKGYYMEYGVDEVRQQIKAVYDAGYEEWILWNSENIYPWGVFEKKQ